MRTVDVSLAALVLALGFGGAALAAHLETVNPADPNFTLTGPIAISAPPAAGGGCNAITLHGTVNGSGAAAVNSISFSGPGWFCSVLLINAPNLPWSLSAPSTTSLKLTGIAFTSPAAAAACGPGDVTMTWSDPIATVTAATLPAAPPASTCRMTFTLTATNLKVVP